MNAQADRLREAARVLRERAATEAILRDGDPYYTTEASTWERITHPGVGLALAAMLSDPTEAAALAVADAILGGAS